MHNQPKLEYVKLKISVVDLGHFLGTVSNLADVRSQIRADVFELEITRDSAAPAASLSPEDQKLLDQVLQGSRDVLAKVQSISTDPPVPPVAPA